MFIIIVFSPFKVMEKIKFLHQNDNTVTFIFNGSLTEANQLRIKMKYHIETYAIDKMIIYNNTSQFNDEFIVHRLSLLVPIHNGNTGILKIKGPKMVKCNDIQNIDFVYNMPIIYLNEQEELDLEVILVKNCGKVHSKWSPFSTLIFNEIDDNQYEFKCELNGLLLFNDILKLLFF